MKEANEIFAHYRVGAGRPPIEAILFNQEDLMRLRSLDHVAYNENLRKKVPTDVLVKRISELNDDFAIQNNGLGFSLEQRLMTYCQKNAYNDELVVQYKGQRRNPYLPSLILGTFVPLNLALLNAFVCHKENLLLNVGNMR